MDVKFDYTRPIEKPPVVFLMGPTASGKTQAATSIYDAFNCELVSVDAAQVYRKMNIGTAKPEQGFLDKYPHHLIDIRDIDETYSAAEFCNDASRLIGEIHERGNIPIFVGGTMFYFSALENGLSNLPSANRALRASIGREVEEKGIEVLYQELINIDPQFASQISSFDSQRIQRAVELHRLTNIPPSQLMAQSKRLGLSSPFVKVTLFTGDRKILHQKIEQRFMQMLEVGLIEEVKVLVEHLDRPQELTAMRTVGYRQVLEFLYENVNYEEMINKSVAATRQLAKRQLTWMRNQSNLVWFDISHPKTLGSILKYLQEQQLSERK